MEIIKEGTYLSIAQSVITIERDALSDLLQRLNDDFSAACDILLSCQGRVIVSGIGKSGHIAKKLAATLASTGTPSFFVHPAEAGHGDLGMITSQDVMLCLSYSGETEELLRIVPLVKRLNVPLISLTGAVGSTLGCLSDVRLDVGVKQEACPLGLAPTASTTVMLALGDALAISLLQFRGFSSEEFALSHPGGSLGRRLLITVDDIMHKGEALPIVQDSVSVLEALFEITDKGLGMAAIINSAGVLVGVFTDGDLRRSLHRKIDLGLTPIHTQMTYPCKTVTPNILAAKALQLIEQWKVNGLVVVDHENKPVGALNMQDLVRAKVL